MKTLYLNVKQKIRSYEQTISLDIFNSIEESHRMSNLLKELLVEMKNHVLANGFSNDGEEIEFFREMKPAILGKLFYYNKVFRIEIARPLGPGYLCEQYYSSELSKLEKSYNSIRNSEFYRYYRSGNHAHDPLYFKRGNIDLSMGLHSFIFESDLNFSTYYDYEVSKIIENDLLHDYLLFRIHDTSYIDRTRLNEQNPIRWTGTKSALVELIYALYASECIDDGDVGISRLSSLFQQVFNIQLGDVHHIFHRMKYRAGSRVLFLERMKSAIEDYMDKEFI